MESSVVEHRDLRRNSVGMSSYPALPPTGAVIISLD